MDTTRRLMMTHWSSYLIKPSLSSSNLVRQEQALSTSSLSVSADSVMYSEKKYTNLRGRLRKVQYMPSWVPSLGRFRKFSNKGRAIVKAMADYPYELVVKERVCDSGISAVTVSWISDNARTPACRHHEAIASIRDAGRLRAIGAVG